MKPGEEGGIEPSIFLRWRLRRRIQTPIMRAAAPMRPRETPRPMPTFCPFVKPGALSTEGLSAKVGLEEDEASSVGEAVSVDAVVPVSVDIVVGVSELVLCGEVYTVDSSDVLSGMLELPSCD